MNESFLAQLLSEIELCTKQRQGSLHLKDPNIENGNPGVLLSNNIFQALGDRNGHEPISVRQKAEYRQWIEYISIYGHLLQNSSSSHQVLRELNSILAMKSFLASSSSQTFIDTVFYRTLHKVMSTLSHQEKEQYIHLSRWFNTVQLDPLARQTRSIVLLSRTPLYI